MPREVHLDKLDTLLAELEYPIDREAARTACDDVTLVLADGTAEFADVLAASGERTFTSVDELRSEVLSLLPRNAVGEPFQSEGEG
jgi:hypothetical protein